MKKIPSLDFNSLIFSEKSFYIASILLLIYGIIGTIYLECFYVAYDVWEHIPQVMAFKDNPLSPVDPYLRGDNISHLLTPYHFLLGVLAHFFGLTPLLVFSVVGIFNLIFFLYSIRVLAEHHFGDKRYSLIVLLVLLFAWLYPPGSSGYYNFALIPLTLAYPYRAVFPLLLITIAKYHTEASPRVHLIYMFAAALAFSIHPLSGIFLLGVIFLKTILAEGDWDRKRVILLLLPCCSLLLTIFWPYYPILGFLLSATKLNVFNLPDAYKFYYQTVWTLLILLIPSLIMLSARIRLKKFDFVFVLILLLIPPLVINYFIIQNEPIARMIVFLTLMSHLLFIEWVIEKMKQINFLQFTIFVSIFTLLLLHQFSFSLQTISIFPEILNGKPIGYFSNFRYYNEYQNLDKWIIDGGVILAPMPVSVMISRTTHQNIVAYYFPNPSIPKSKEKSADVVKYFSTSSIMEKNSILKKYRVKYLVSKENPSMLREQGLKLKQLGSIDNFPVYKILDINER